MDSSLDNLQLTGDPVTVVPEASQAIAWSGLTLVVGLLAVWGRKKARHSSTMCE